MKTSILWLCCAIFSANLTFSQAFQFNVSTNSYTNLSGSTSCNNGLTWDDPNFTIPIGFTFNYLGRSIDTLLLSWGYGGTLLCPINANGTTSILSPFGSDLMDRGYVFSAGPGQSGSLSNISYITIGSSPNRVFKLEWNNAGFYGDIQRRGANAPDYVNFQLWLYEGIDRIEIHFGPSSVSNPIDSYDGFSGPDILLIPSFNLNTLSFVGNYYSLAGAPASPSLQTKSSSQLPSYINGTIPNGTVYRFNPLSTKLDESSHSEAYFIFPQPADQYFSIRLENGDDPEEIRLSTLDGRLLKLFDQPMSYYNISDLASAVYLIEIRSGKELYRSKMIIQH